MRALVASRTPPVVPMDTTRVMLTMAALGLAFVPTTSAGGLDLLELLGDTEGSGAEASCGQFGTEAHGWGSGASASASMRTTTGSGGYGSGNDAYAWAEGFGGGSASARGGPWTAYCNSTLLGLVDNTGESTLACTTGSGFGEFSGDVLQAADGALYLSDGAVAYAMAGTLDLGQAVSVPLPEGLADTGVDIVYSNGAGGCAVEAV